MMLKIHYNRLPHWVIEGSFYMITFDLEHGVLSECEIQLVLEHVKSGDENFYKLIAVQVMPDHVHIIIAPDEKYSVQRIVKGIKGVTAHKINTLRGTRGTIWMVDYYDRIIRSQSDLDEKINYIYDNPVRAELTENPADYIGWHLNVS